MKKFLALILAMLLTLSLVSAVALLMTPLRSLSQK